MKLDFWRNSMREFIALLDRFLLQLNIVFLVFVLVACQAQSTITPTVQSTSNPTAPLSTESSQTQILAPTTEQIKPSTPTIEISNQANLQAPTENPGGEGLTYQEMRANTPPPPLNLQAKSAPRGVRLDWEPSPPPEIAHNYSDVIIAYNIYRRTESEMTAKLLATVNEPHFIDESVQTGLVYYYAVSAVHEGPVEGQKTEEISWSMP